MVMFAFYLPLVSLKRTVTLVGAALNLMGDYGMYSNQYLLTE